MTDGNPHDVVAASNAISDLNDGGDDALRHLVSLLRQKEPNRRLVQMVVMMLDPDGSGFQGMRLVVKRTRRGTPKKVQFPGLEHFVDVNCIFLPDGNQEEVAAIAHERFGCSRSTFFETLKRRRQYWSRRDDLLALLRESAEALREHGHPDYL